MTGTGLTTMVFQGSILMSIDTGEITIETIAGTDTSGIINGFRMNGFTRTGKVGKGTERGEGRKSGVSRDTHLEHKRTRRCSDSKDSVNINRGLRFRDISSTCENKDNHKGLKKDLGEEGKGTESSRQTNSDSSNGGVRNGPAFFVCFKR